MQTICKNCGKEFKIRPEDSIFYEQVEVQAPQYCPPCRAQRRLAFRNERTLYRRVCDLCKKDGVSIYPSNTPFPVYCHKCWWSDGWDPTAFAQAYDPNKKFLDQFLELKNKVPRIALLVIDSVNSDYINNAGMNKNCYLIFAAEYNEDCAYSRLIMKSKSIFDCVATYESELCYELLDSKNCFKCMYSERLQECSDVMFSFDMKNCQNCLFCTNGRNWNYYIDNVKHTKEEYETKVKEIFSSTSTLLEAKNKYLSMRSKALVKYASAIKCNNATGDYMYNCHDGINLFDVRNSKNCSYVADGEDPTDCQDVNNMYFKAERCFNVMGSLSSSKCIAGTYIMHCSETIYSDSCYHCTSCFGCVGLNKKNYHILNKEYSKEEYKQIKEKIIKELKTDGTYGEFFPPTFSPFGYNETLAQEYYPLTEDEAKTHGFNWQTETSGTFGKETIKKGKTPDKIADVNDDILKEVLVCEKCDKNFRITKLELDFYKRLGIPLPSMDFECRHQERMSRRNPRLLWHRSCMCNISTHQHGTTKCPNEFETSYSPERTEVIYCETCYQQEVS